MTKPVAELTRNDDGWILKPVGKIDSATMRLMLFVENGVSLLKELMPIGAKRLCIDLIATDSIDADGFRFLLGTQKEFADAGIQIVLQNPNPYLRRLIKLMKFDHFFVVEPDE